MNAPVWSAMFGTLVAVGLVGAALALRLQPVREPVARRPSVLGRRLAGTSRRTRLVLVVSVGGLYAFFKRRGWL